MTPGDRGPLEASNPRTRRRRRGATGRPLLVVAGAGLLLIGAFAATAGMGDAALAPQTVQPPGLPTTTTTRPTTTTTRPTTTTTRATTTTTHPSTTTTTTPPTTTTTTTASATTTTTAPSTTTTTVPIPPQDQLPPAPAGFSSQIDSVYAAVYGAVQASGAGSQSQQSLPSPSAYDQQVAQFSSTELSDYYAATQNVPSWSNLPTTYQQLTSQLSAGSTQTAAAMKANAKFDALLGTPVKRRKGKRAPSPKKVFAELVSAEFPPAGPSPDFPAPPNAYSPSSPVAPAVVPTCPQPPPGNDDGIDGIWDAQTAADVLTEVSNAIPDQIGAIVDGTTEVLNPDPLRIVAQVAATAAQLVTDTLQFIYNIANDCGAVTAGDLATNIDNTTVNTYDLLYGLDGTTLDNVESSVNTIDQQLGVLQQTLDDQLTLAIEQALTAPATSVPDIAFELPTSVGGNLDSTPIGVQSIVNSAISDIQSAKEPLDAAAEQDVSQGNSDYAAQNYPAAYAAYHAAYLAAVG